VQSRVIDGLDSSGYSMGLIRDLLMRLHALRYLHLTKVLLNKIPMSFTLIILVQLTALRLFFESDNSYNILFKPVIPAFYISYPTVGRPGLTAAGSAPRPLTEANPEGHWGFKYNHRTSVSPSGHGCGSPH
jgi:hypothetical protein